MKKTRKFISSEEFHKETPIINKEELLDDNFDLGSKINKQEPTALEEEVSEPNFYLGNDIIEYPTEQEIKEIFESEEDEEETDPFSLGIQEDEVSQKEASPFFLGEEPTFNEVSADINSGLDDIDISKKTSVLFIGNNNTPFFKQLTESITKKEPTISFEGAVSVGGKTIFHLIDSYKPDILLLKHDVLDISKVIEEFNMGTDTLGVPYQEKYKNMRIVVISPDDIHYEMQIKKIGARLLVKENRKVELFESNLIQTITSAKNDILISLIAEQKKAKEKLLLKEERKNQLIEENLRRIKEQKEINQEEEMKVKEAIEEAIIETVEEELEEQIEDEPFKLEEANTIKELDFNAKNKLPKVISVYSPTGGSGKTVFSSNLASCLQKYSNINSPSQKYKVALIEYNLENKNFDLFFDAPKNTNNLTSLLKEYHSAESEIQRLYNEYKNNNPNKTHEEYLDYYEKIKHASLKQLIEKNMVIDKNTGLHLLMGLNFSLEIVMEKIDEETSMNSKTFTMRLVDVLSEMYDLVIFDLPSSLSQVPLLDVIQKSDELYNLINMNTVSIRNTINIFQLFIQNKFAFDSEKVKFVINKATDTNEFTLNAAMNELKKEGCNVFAIIPNEEVAVLSSINKGYPLVLEDINNPFSQAIFNIAETINPMMSAVVPETKEKKKSLFSLPSIFTKKESKQKTKKKELLSKNNKALEKEIIKNVEKVISKKEEKKSFFTMPSFFSKKEKGKEVEVEIKQSSRKSLLPSFKKESIKEIAPPEQENFPMKKPQQETRLGQHIVSPRRPQ